MVSAIQEVKMEIPEKFPRKWVVSMPDSIEAIPEKARWEIATKGLTGAYIAISNALKQAVGQQKFEEFNGPLWHEAAKGAKGFADSFGLATETPGDVEAITHLFAKAAMGPEFKFEIVESTKDRCVGTTTECPWHKRWKEQGLDMDTCGAGHQAWGSGAAESLNPNFTFKLTKNMLRGDSHCEWVVERKK
jgi:hypothetical protein